MLWCVLLSTVFLVCSGTHTPEEKEIIKLTQQLINSIADRDYKEYRCVCVCVCVCVCALVEKGGGEERGIEREAVVMMCIINAASYAWRR